MARPSAITEVECKSQNCTESTLNTSWSNNGSTHHDGKHNPFLIIHPPLHYVHTPKHGHKNLQSVCQQCFPPVKTDISVHPHEVPEDKNHCIHLHTDVSNVFQTAHQFKYIYPSEKKAPEH
uniref:Uncharacterized protein n=1 Tax=Nothobranchius kuhntae TaxID=321403 RepID=A0A1A8JXH4_NOTKU